MLTHRVTIERPVEQMVDADTREVTEFGNSVYEFEAIAENVACQVQPIGQLQRVAGQ